MLIDSEFPLFLGMHFYIYEIRIECTTGRQEPNWIADVGDHSWHLALRNVV